MCQQSLFRVNQVGTKYDTIFDQRATVYFTKSLVVLDPFPFNVISSLKTTDYIYIVLPFDVISETIHMAPPRKMGNSDSGKKGVSFRSETTVAI